MKTDSLRARSARRRSRSALAVPAAGVSKATALPTAVGPGEGKLKLVAWEGYTEKQWVAPFEKQTGCKVSVEVRRHARTRCST